MHILFLTSLISGPIPGSLQLWSKKIWDQSDDIIRHLRGPLDWLLKNQTANQNKGKCDRKPKGIQLKKKWTNEAPRNAGNQITMSFSLASHCSKGWSERSGTIIEQSLLANSRRDQKLRHSLNNIVSRHCNFSKGLGNLVGIETSNRVWQLCTFQSRIKVKLFVWPYCFYFFCIHPKVAHIQPLGYL